MRSENAYLLEPLDARVLLSTVTFREGVDGYGGTQDTHARLDAPGTSFGSAAVVVVDQDDNGAAGSQPSQGLVRFTGLFGSGAGQIPSGASISSATLTIQTGAVSGDSSSDATTLHRMLVDWAETATWDGLAGGVNVGSDAGAAEGSVVPSTVGGLVNFNVTAALQAWAASPSSNFGWALLPAGTNGWRWDSSEAATTSRRPVLSVTFTTGEPGVNQAPQVSAGADKTVSLPDSAALDGTVNDDGLPGGSIVSQWTRVSGPGTVTFANASAVDTTASFSSAGTYVLRLSASDGALAAADDVTVTVQSAPTAPTTPTVQQLNSVQSTRNTGEKPQSKVWKHANTWWSVFPNSSGTWVWRLDNTTWNPVFRINTRTSGKADVLPVGDVAHVLLYDGSGSTRLASVQYVPGSPGTYQFWSQRSSVPTVTLSSGVEMATVAMDGAGRMWVASDSGSSIEVRYSDGNYGTWSAPITIASGIGSDDICDIATLPNGSVAVLWSNQTTKRWGFRTHAPGAAPSTWTADENPASQSALNVGAGFADDHMSLAVTSDGSVYAGVKTSYDTSGRPVIGLLVRRPNGQWDNFYSVDTDLGATRPIAVVNEAQGIVMVVYRSGAHNIVYRQAPLSSPGSLGPRTTLISGGVNNVSSTRQVLGADAVFLASDYPAGSTEVVRSVRFVWPAAPISSGSLFASGTSRDHDSLFASSRGITEDSEEDELLPA